MEEKVKTVRNEKPTEIEEERIKRESEEIRKKIAKWREATKDRSINKGE